MRLPDFLIIGAPKSGTTTLYRDLLLNSSVYFPLDKEPGNLCYDRVLGPDGLREYARLYADAGPEQVCGDATTSYSKLPDVPGVPERATKVLGHSFKIVYLVRDPISRIISHHRHEYHLKHTTWSIDEAVSSDHRFLAYSRYAMQLRPWLERVRRSNTLVVLFEDYVRNRRDTVKAISEFLGIAPSVDRIDPAMAYNRSSIMPRLVGPWRWLRETSLYQHRIRPLLSIETRRTLRHLLLPGPPALPPGPKRSSILEWIQSLEEDFVQHEEVLGRTPWTSKDLRRKHVDRVP